MNHWRERSPIFSLLSSVNKVEISVFKQQNRPFEFDVKIQESIDETNTLLHF
jgi:hypothetical protein